MKGQRATQTGTKPSFLVGSPNVCLRQNLTFGREPERRRRMAKFGPVADWLVTDDAKE